jgi:hypothetical protein
MNTKDLALNPYPGIMLIGDSGTHKTFFLGSVPSIKIFDFDATMAVLRGKDIEFWRFKDAPKGSKRIDPSNGIYEWGTAYVHFLTQLNKVGDGIEELAKQGQIALGFDSLTSLGNIALNYVLKTHDHDSTKPIDQGLWGFQSRLLETVVDQLTAWPVIKVMTSHIQRDTNAITGNVEKLPLTTGKFAAKVSSFFDEVYYTDVVAAPAPTGSTVKGQKFILHTQQAGIMKHAKSPFGVPEGTEASWQAVAPYITGKPAPKK